jgi:hypothetical protein
MQLECGHQFAVVLTNTEAPHQVLGQERVTNDLWRPAIECGRLEAARRDRRRPPQLPVGPGVIEPLWHETLKAPYLGGFRLTLPTEGAPCVQDFGTDYFGTVAQQLLEQLVAAKQVPADTACGYVVCAFPRSAAAESPPAGRPRGWSAKPKAQTLALDELPLPSFLDRSAPHGAVPDDLVPVFIPERVLAEMAALHGRAGAAETGGNLIGYLHRDPARPETLFAEVTAQVPAQHAQQELTRLTFTPETWADVDAAIRLRGRAERKLGWWHSHPARQWCEKCPAEKRQACPRGGDFFSVHDAALHLAAYPMAYSVALVLSDSYAHGLAFTLFGWRQGRLARRGFHWLDSDGSLARLDRSPSTLGEHPHERACDFATESR